jgi:hypothetical protein
MGCILKRSGASDARSIVKSSRAGSLSTFGSGTRTGLKALTLIGGASAIGSAAGSASSARFLHPKGPASLRQRRRIARLNWLIGAPRPKKPKD